jgi:hypothetical protein
MQKSNDLIKRYFCTLFDTNYLLKGVVMLRTLRQNCAGSHVYVLCMDEPCRRMLEQLGLPGLTCISLPEVENTELLAAKKSRNIAEYCWTLSSSLTAWVMDRYQDVDLITYLDADLMFYSSVEPLFEEIGNSSIAIIEHRFTPRLKNLEENGRFCVEWVTFRRDIEGQACLRRWRDQCVEWCYARLDGGRMGDQKYLDEWPTGYSSTHVLQHLGAGLAPWNYPNYGIRNDEDGQIVVDGVPLIFYHFHQFQLLDDGSFDRVSAFYTKETGPPEEIYRLYEEQINKAVFDVRLLVPGFSGGMRSTAYISSRRWAHRFLPRRLKELLKRVVRY